MSIRARLGRVMSYVAAFAVGATIGTYLLTRQLISPKIWMASFQVCQDLLHEQRAGGCVEDSMQALAEAYKEHIPPSRPAFP